MDTIADRIRRARRVKRWSQSELATALGVSTSAVGHWERPRGPLPSTEHLISIAQRLSVSLEWLATGKGASPRTTACASQRRATLNCDEEQEILNRYRELPEESRALFIQLISSFRSSASV